MRLRWIGALAALLAACGPPPEVEPTCPEWFVDRDGDGFGDASAQAKLSCEPVPGHVGNSYDCDDDDDAIHPHALESCDPDGVDENCDGLVNNDDPHALGRAVRAWRDADRDGHAVLRGHWVCEFSDEWLPAPGRDCDDADPLVNPLAPDPIDGVDTNCDHFDGYGIYEDFELGAPDPWAWASVGDLSLTEGNVREGRYAGRLTAGAAPVSATLDTSVCKAVAWHFFARSGGREGQFQYWDGADWQVLATVGPADTPSWEHRWGSIEVPSARHADFRVRFATTGWAGGALFIDRVMVGCHFEHDADGVPDGIDCAPTDSRHWFDCGVCVDDDDDGFGVGCDLGPDCDDADPFVHPAAPDPPGDGHDTDCSGRDGPSFFDDFDAGPDATLWTLDPGASLESEVATSPPYSLVIRETGVATTPFVDTSACDEGIWWGFQGRALYAPTRLTLSWEGPDGWVEEQSWQEAPAEFAFRSGSILDPAARRSAGRVRLEASGQAWAVDDFVVACFIDADGDGLPDDGDCAPDDPLHWHDCGLCVDADGDDYGEGCDLGPDCDDGRSDVHPGLLDAEVDGVDQDCDGLDGPPLFAEAFGPGGLDAAKWSTSQGVQLGYEGDPLDHFARFPGYGGALETAPLDTTGCSGLGWSLVGRSTSPFATLWLEAWNGNAWVQVGSWQPPNVGSGRWWTHIDELPDAWVNRPDLQLRLRGDSPYGQHVDLSSVALGCPGP